jgi:hypothetical protein
MEAYPCPCCSYLAFDEPASGTFLICPVCAWEDDPIQLNNPEYRGGASQCSLNDAKMSYRQHGVSDLRLRDMVREPLPNEIPKQS